MHPSWPSWLTMASCGWVLACCTCPRSSRGVGWRQKCSILPAQQALPQLLTFSGEKFVISSFGIMMWEILAGPGLRLPYDEYGDKVDFFHFLTKQGLVRIREMIQSENVRRTLPEEAELYFGADPNFWPFVQVAASI